MSDYTDLIDSLAPRWHFRFGASAGTTESWYLAPSAVTQEYFNSPTLGVAGAIVGDADTAVNFPLSSGSYVRSQTQHALWAASPRNSFSVVLWFKTTFGSGQTLFDWGQSGSGNHFSIWGRSSLFQIFYEANGHTEFQQANGGPSEFVDWQMATVVRNGTSLKMYIGETEITDATVTNNDMYLAATSWLFFAAEHNGSGGAQNTYSPSLDEFSLFDRALTPAEVSSIYLTGIGQFNIVDLTAAISLDTLPVADIAAQIKMDITETVDLTAPIELATDRIDLTAPIRLETYDTVDLTANLLVQHADQTFVDVPAGYWTLALAIDGVDISSQITGQYAIESEEDSSSLASITIYPPDGPFLLTDYVGKKIALTHQFLDNSGITLAERLIYRGYVSDPYFDPDRGRLVLECTTDAQGTFDRASREEIEGIVAGSWSPFVFEEGAQGFDYASDRLRTRSASFWSSPTGFVITDWEAKTTADIEFTDANVIDNSIGYETATRRDLLNKVDITFDYRFDRLRQRTLECNFRMTNTFCDLLINGFNICQRSQVEAASSGGGWYRQGDIRFEPLPPAGSYRCFPGAAGPASVKYIGWGRLFFGALLDDPDWGQLCWGATWRVAKRWAQKITERYQIVVQAPQSQSGNGLIVTQESYSLVSTQDVKDWLKEENFDGTGSKTFDLIQGYDSDSYKIGDAGYDATDDTLTGRAAANNAREVVIQAAVADVLQAHRQTSVVFSTTFHPDVDLTKTVRLNTTNLVAKGKVRRVRHTFDIETGQAETEIELAISRHFGTGLVTTSSLTPEDPPDKPVEADFSKQKTLGSYVGGLKITPVLTGDEEGYFTNYVFDFSDTDPFAAVPSDPVATFYEEAFIVNYPEISGAALNATELPAEQIIDVEVPEDELTLIQ